MSVTFEFVGQIKRSAGTDKFIVSGEDALSLMAGLGAAAKKFGSEFSALLFQENGALRTSLVIAVNDEQVSDVATAKLNGGDKVLILTPMSGG